MSTANSLKEEMKKDSADSLKLISRSEYRAELRKHLPIECFKADKKHCLFYTTCMVLYLAGIFSIMKLDLWPLKFLISAVMGITLTSLTFFLHDLFHSSIVRSNKIQYLLGFTIGIFNLFPPLFWKRVHNYHHARTGNIDDPDRSYIISEAPKSLLEKLAYKIRLTQESLNPVISLFAMSAGFLFYFGNNIISGLFPKASFTTNKSKNVRYLFKNKERLIIVFELVSIFAFQLYLFLYVAKGLAINYLLISLMPVAVAHCIAMAYIHTNHFLSPLTGETDDPLINSLSLKNHPLIDKIFSNFSHHTEHHLFPEMSSKYYPTVRKLLFDLFPERFNIMPMKRAIKLLMKTPRIYNDFTHLITVDKSKIIKCPVLIKSYIS